MDCEKAAPNMVLIQLMNGVRRLHQEYLGRTLGRTRRNMGLSRSKGRGIVLGARASEHTLGLRYCTIREDDSKERMPGG